MARNAVWFVSEKCPHHLWTMITFSYLLRVFDRASPWELWPYRKHGRTTEAGDTNKMWGINTTWLFNSSLFCSANNTKHVSEWKEYTLVDNLITLSWSSVCSVHSAPVDSNHCSVFPSANHRPAFHTSGSDSLHPGQSEPAFLGAAGQHQVNVGTTNPQRSVTWGLCEL